MSPLLVPPPPPSTHQYVGAGDAAEPEVLDGALLQLHVRVAELAVGAQHLLDGGLHLGEQVDELDVGRQQQGPRGHRAQVELGVEELELHQRTGRREEEEGGRRKEDNNQTRKQMSECLCV